MIMSRERPLTAVVIFTLFVLIIAAVIISGDPELTAPRKKPFNAPPTDPELEDIGAAIERRVERMNGVLDASVLVLSRTALVALELEEALSPEEIDRIKRETADYAKGFPKIDEVLVTADPNLVAEIKEVLKGEAPLESLEDIYKKIRGET